MCFILDNAPDHPEPHEFNTSGAEVVYLPPTTVSVIQSLEQGIIRTFQAQYTWSFMGINAVKENPNRENILKV